MLPSPDKVGGNRFTLTMSKDEMPFFQRTRCKWRSPISWAPASGETANAAFALSRAETAGAGMAFES